MMIPNRYQTVEKFCNTCLAWAARQPNGFHISDFFTREEEVKKAYLEREKFRSNKGYWIRDSVDVMLKQAPIQDWVATPMNIYQGLLRGFISYESVAAFEHGFGIIRKTQQGNPLWDPVRSNLITYSNFCRMDQTLVFEIRKDFH